MLGVSLRTAQLWVDSGILQAWKTVGGHRRITVESVERLKNERVVDKLKPAPRAYSGKGTGGEFSILVVEDEADLLVLYRATISTWGLPIRLVTARNGFEGLLKIGESRPDLLITDLVMPGMDGFRMIATLRGNRHFDDMQIAVVSGLSQAEIAEHGGLPQNVALFGKPVPFQKLEALVRLYSARRKGQEQEKVAADRS